MNAPASRPNIPARSGGQVLVDALRIHGARTVYSVPGESFISVLEALYQARDGIKLVITRQEGGAAHMAEAYGKLTGEPGICFVTRGPGATQASIKPPTFILFVNDPALVHFGYRRYLERAIRDAYDFEGTVIRVVYRSRGEGTTPKP